MQFSDYFLRGAGQLPGDVPHGAVTDQDLIFLKGATLRADAKHDHWVTFSELELRGDAARIGARIPHGMRAYELRLDESLKVQPTDSVDVLAVPRMRGESPVILVEGATVLASEGAEDGSRVTLALEPSEVALVEKAAQTGKLKLSLRNPDDENPPNRSHAGRSSRRRIPAERVEIWSEAP